MRTAARIEEVASLKKVATEQAIGQPKKKRGNPNPRTDQIKPYQWVKGVSGNAGGRPKIDRAAELAREILEANPEAYYRGFAEQLSKGNAYAFGVLADRAFGKLKETKEITHIHQDVPDTDLQRRIDELIRDCGLAQQVDEAGGVKEPSGRTESAQVKTEDSTVLS
jgi:hypothetical protein